MAVQNRVVITGIGLVSSLGEGTEAHWRALGDPRASMKLDTEHFRPYPVHPLPEIDWNLQIPKRGDQRQMETWQRLGTYTAGLALDDAGMKTDEALCASMDMIVGAGGGERDVDVDTLILTEGRASNDRDVMLNQKLSTELRPTLFLAQLSNLLAGNISIVHKVTGSSRTFMGEEGSGIAAVETATARIRAGQSTHALVGGAYNAEHANMLLGMELGRHLLRGEWAPLWHRRDKSGGGVVTGSGAAFLVLESAEHAAARGARVYGTIDGIVTGQARRKREKLRDVIAAMLRQLNGSTPFIVSGTSGADEATAEEKAALDTMPGAVVRAFSDVAGYMREAQFPFTVALAALAVSKGEAWPPFDAEAEAPSPGGPIDAAIALTVGADRAEGVVRIVKA